MEVETSPSSRKIAQSKRGQKKLIWESLKDEIYRLYFTENKTLRDTMRDIQEHHGFKASERTWKEKMKEWKFDKYMTTTDMSVIVAKSQKRAKEGKKTAFFLHGAEINPERLETFKKRKTSETIEVASPIPDTPGNITYGTPLPRNAQELFQLQDMPPPNTPTINSEKASGARIVSVDKLLQIPASESPGNLNSVPPELTEYAILHEIFEVDQLRIGQDTLQNAYLQNSSFFSSSVASWAVNKVVDWVRDKSIHEKVSTFTRLVEIKYLLAIVCLVNYVGDYWGPSTQKELLEDFALDFLRLLEISSSTFEDSRAIPTYRRLLALFENCFGISNSVTIRMCATLAGICSAQLPSERENLYRKSIAGFGALKMPYHRLVSQLSLWKILRSGHCLEEAADLLASSISTFIVKDAAWSAPARWSHSAPILSLHCSGQYWEKIRAGEWNSGTVGDNESDLALAVDAVLSTLTELLTDVREYNLQMQVKLLDLAGEIAVGLSIGGERSAAASIFKVIVPKLSALGFEQPKEFMPVKAHGHLQYCIHHFHQAHWRRCFEHMSSAFQAVLNSYECHKTSGYGNSNDAMKNIAAKANCEILVKEFISARATVLKRLNAQPRPIARFFLKSVARLTGQSLPSQLENKVSRSQGERDTSQIEELEYAKSWDSNSESDLGELVRWEEEKSQVEEEGPQVDESARAATVWHYLHHLSGPTDGQAIPDQSRNHPAPDLEGEGPLPSLASSAGLFSNSVDAAQFIMPAISRLGSTTTGSKSNKYGVTYTDSVVTGVSFSYSALFPWSGVTRQ